MLNRSALILTYEQPFIDWINAADPGPDRMVSLEEANQEQTVYLIDEVDGEGEIDAWLLTHHQELFERELHAWYTDAALWPADRSLSTLRRWCAIEMHSVIVDIGELPLIDDELDD